MIDEPLDVELEKLDISSPVSAPRPIAPVIALATFIVLASAAIYVVLFRRPVPATPAGARTAPTTQAQAADRPLGGDALPIDVPPLDATDPVVRTLVSSLSANPAIASWLATNGLIRQFVVAIANVAEGETPAARLKVIAPRAPFLVVERDGRTYVDPRSYERYQPLATAAASLDAQGAARLYATLKPRFEEAYQELGLHDGSFDAAFRRTIVMLMRTPVVTGPIPLRAKGVGYRYDEERLERLTAGQKQLLRMGPENLRRVKATMRDLALELGVSASEMPDR